MKTYKPTMEGFLRGEKDVIAWSRTTCPVCGAPPLKWCSVIRWPHWIRPWLPVWVRYGRFFSSRKLSMIRNHDERIVTDYMLHDEPNLMAEDSQQTAYQPTSKP